MSMNVKQEELTAGFFLVSFPRSGNTWVRFLIANVYNNMEKRFSEIDFFNIHEIVPEYEKEEKCMFSDFPPVFKTHSRYRPRFKNNILVLRNPFDVLYSYFDFLNKNKGVSISLPDTVMHEKHGIRAIVEHTNSYTGNCKNLLITTYEKLQDDPGAELEKICDFLEFDVPGGVIAEAVQRSSFGAMSKIEKQKGRKHGNPDFKHIRKGQVGEGEAAIRKENDLYDYVIKELKKSPLLYLLYY